MKDAEMRDILTTLQAKGAVMLTDGKTSLEETANYLYDAILALIAALEANPPLAEVDMDAIYDVAGDDYRVELWLQLEDAPRQDVPVTVTIRKRDV